MNKILILLKFNLFYKIVRILRDESFCFNTKNRVPYKLVVETIDVNENM